MQWCLLAITEGLQGRAHVFFVLYSPKHTTYPVSIQHMCAKRKNHCLLCLFCFCFCFYPYKVCTWGPECPQRIVLFSWLFLKIPKASGRETFVAFFQIFIRIVLWLLIKGSWFSQSQSLGCRQKSDQGWQHGVLVEWPVSLSIYKAGRKTPGFCADDKTRSILGWFYRC